MQKLKSKYLGWLLLGVSLLLLVSVFLLLVGGRSTNSTPAIAGHLPADLNYQSVEEVYDLLRERFDGSLDWDDLITGLKKGLVEATGDPHSEYLDADETKSFDDFLSGQFEGIGVEITNRDGFLAVVAPIDGSPAKQAGILAGDLIFAIDGQPTSQMTITEAVNMIRGPAGTTVELRIHRDISEPIILVITRDLISVPPVSWRFEDGVGIIRLSYFSDQTVELLAQAAIDLTSQNPQGLVLDLRSNPGGEVESALGVLGFWLPAGQSAVEYYIGGQSVESGLVPVLPNSDLIQSVFANKSTVVLIDGGSASASEIVAGALQDYEVATLVGQKSFGKGSVQQLIRLGDNNGDETLKLTISRFYTPLGQPIDGSGLTPDFTVLNSETDGVVSDLQLQKAKELIKQN